MKKVTNLLLAALMTSAIANPVLAITPSAAIASPAEALKVEQGVLQDLRSQLQAEQRHRRNGYIALAASATSVAAGVILSLGEGFMNMGVNIFTTVAGGPKLNLTESMLPKVLFLGGAAGAVGSTIYVVVKSSDISKLLTAVDAEEKKVSSLISQLNQ